LTYIPYLWPISVMQCFYRPPSRRTSCREREKVYYSGNQSTRHTVKWCAELTIVSDGVVTSWPYFLT